MNKFRHWLSARLRQVAYFVMPLDGELSIGWGDVNGKPNGRVYTGNMPQDFSMSSRQAIAFADGITRAALNSDPQASPLAKGFNRTLEASVN